MPGDGLWDRKAHSSGVAASTLPPGAGLAGAWSAAQGQDGVFPGSAWQ